MKLFLAIAFLTQALMPNIKSLQVRSSESDYLPIIALGGDGQISVSFDELSQEGHHYSYEVLHCNRQWQQDDLFTSDYLLGFTTADIVDYETSINTRQLYTHYAITLPNEDMQFTRSGNYVLRVYEDGDKDQVALTARFMINEGGAKVSGSVTPNTDRELSRRLQQVELQVNTQELDCTNPTQDIRVLVQQNERLDNQVWLERPNQIQGSTLVYQHNPALIFEGGNEYRRFDIASLYLAGTGVDRIRFDRDRDRYQAWLDPLQPRKAFQYETDQDINGRYIIHTERVEDVNLEGDYMEVHLVLQGVPERLGEALYLSGEAFGQGALLPQNRLLYDRVAQVYYKDMLLKQGGYNYLILTQSQEKEPLPNGALTEHPRSTPVASPTQSVAYAEPVEGSYWQTENEYLVLIYQHSTTDRYDRLVGWQLISTKKIL